MNRDRKPILLRLDPAVHDALAQWAADELRSLNAQIEMLLRRALTDRPDLDDAALVRKAFDPAASGQVAPIRRPPTRRERLEAELADAQRHGLDEGVVEGLRTELQLLGAS